MCICYYFFWPFTSYFSFIIHSKETHIEHPVWLASERWLLRELSGLGPQEHLDSPILNWNIDSGGPALAILVGRCSTTGTMIAQILSCP